MAVKTQGMRKAQSVAERAIVWPVPCTAPSGMTLWEFAVFSYLMVNTGNPRHTLSFPTLAACEAARQAVLEIAQEERPNPVVGLCKQTERESLVGGRTPNAEPASSETTRNTPRNTPRAVRDR